MNITPIIRNVRSVSKLYGKYIANHKFAKVELNIKSDGTYDQKVTLIPSSEINSVNGAWSYDNYDLIFDHNFMSVTDGFGNFDPNYSQPRESGIVILPVYRWFFNIYIGSSEGTKYIKN